MDRVKAQQNIDAFRTLASQQGWAIDSERELHNNIYQLRITHGTTTVPITFFHTGTVLIQGKPSELQRFLNSWWTKQKAQKSPPSLWNADTQPTTEVPSGLTIPTNPKLI
ncbi:MAG TPA: hypothetical protein VKY19_17580 [Ktedonosporobacter sp.]|nr:hypothetical protein [Ktedonosporobacter sp.]